MSYIKIYPKSLTLLDTQGSTLLGQVIFNIEQYGQLHQNLSFKIRIEHSVKAGGWAILAVEDNKDIKNFESFIKTLNFYVFQNLKTQFSPPSDSIEFTPFEIALREVYFALDPDNPGGSQDYRWGKIK